MSATHHDMKTIPSAEAKNFFVETFHKMLDTKGLVLTPEEQKVVDNSIKMGFAPEAQENFYDFVREVYLDLSFHVQDAFVIGEGKSEKVLDLLSFDQEESWENAYEEFERERSGEGSGTMGARV